MVNRPSILARLILSVVTLLSGVAIDSSPPEQASSGPLAGYRPEVRLRKLHLVRPDLIPYPIALDIYC